MRIEELRIGNLVYGVSDRLEIITELKKNTCITDHYKNSLLSAPHEVEYKYINSIPLTEEILLKCGFEKGENYFSLYDFDIDLNGWFGFNNMVANANIKYLHQLQNLYFALTNKELNIEL